MQKKVTVVVRTYSRSQNLPAVIGSAADQSYENLRIVVCDNSPKGDGERFVKETRKRFPSRDITYFHYPKEPDGIGHMNFNYTVARCCPTDYIGFLEDDAVFIDRYFIERAVRILDEYPEVVYAAGGQRSEGKEIKMWSQDMVIPGENLWERWPGVWLYYGACVYRYEVYVGAGMSPGDCQHADSLYLLYPMLVGKVALLNTVCIDTSYGKTDSAVEELNSDPMTVLQSEHEYLSHCVHFAVLHGISRERAERWYIGVMTAALMNAINVLPPERADELTDWLHHHDQRVTDSLIRHIVTRSGSAG